MNISKFKKGLSLIIAVVMIFTMIPTSLYALGADKSLPMMYSFNAASSKDFHKYYKQVYTVTFLNEIDYEAKENALESWDISANADSGEVVGWMYLNQEATDAAGEERYDVYVAGEGGVEAHPDTTHMFYVFSSLKEVNGMENFHTGKVKNFLYWFGNCYALENIDLSKIDTSSATSLQQMFYACYVLKEADLRMWDVSNVTTIKYMFYRCYELKYANLSGWDTSNITNMYGVFEMTPPKDVSPEYSLEEVNLTGWDTSNVTTMENMFKNCEALKELDLSSFDTSNVTTMRFMFYYCKSLKNIYVGEGWTTEAIANINDGVFNCCYAIVGGTDDQEKNIEIYNEKHPSAYYPPSVEYAKTKEEGGYLTDVSQKPEPEKKSYTVTYSFIGETVPAGVTPPASAVYEEGTKAFVEADAYADGYEFSGWTTTDAEVTGGEFTVNNDVHFVGSWSELYDVRYEYADGYPIPQDAPTAEMLEMLASSYKAGELVDVTGVMYADGYIFIGWYTEDADVAGSMFFMPENDVTLYGYFKKPVESVEFTYSEDNIVLNSGESEKLNVYVKPEDATIKEIIFESDNVGVVTVDKYGNINAVGPGTATITVKSADDDTKSDTITVTVKNPVTDIEVNKNVFILNKGDTEKIEADVAPENATNKKIIYESGDDSIVTVDENGNILAVNEGTTTVTIKSEDNPDVWEKVTVTVKIPVTEITVAEKELVVELDSEEIISIDATVNDDATDKELIYDSQNIGVAKVSSDGTIIPVSEGKTVVTVKSKDNPEVYETVGITVIRKYKVTYEFIGEVIPSGVTAPEAAEYVSGSQVTVEADASAEGYVFSGWSTKDSADIKDGKFIINNDVHFVGSWSKLYNVTYEYEGEVPADAPALPEKQAYEAGTAVDVKANPVVDGYTFSGWVTSDAAVADGSFIMPENDVVLKGSFEPTVIKVDKVEADKESITLTVGDTDRITVSVTPENATDKEVTFESSNDDIVRVDENGNLTAIGPGEATVTITSKDGSGKKDTVTVTVKRPVINVEEVKADKEEINLEIGQTDKITATVTPDNASNTDVMYETSDRYVVQVDENGNIVAVGEGTAIITVKSKDDHSKYDTVKVTVKKPYAPVTSIIADKKISIVLGEEKEVGARVDDKATNKGLTYESDNEAVVKVDANGILTSVNEGTAKITVRSLENPAIYAVITVEVTAKPVSNTKHYMVFGKTEKIGWYNVSLDGGETYLLVFGNSHLEVEHGQEVIIRANDVFGDPFTFYINGNAVTPDENGYVRVTVDKYVLVGALGIPIVAPDAEESLNFIEKLIKAIKDFFAKIASWFKR